MRGPKRWPCMHNCCSYARWYDSDRSRRAPPPSPGGPGLARPGAVDPDAAGAAVLVDEGEVAIEVLGFGPEGLAGAEAVGAEGVAELVVGRDPAEPGEQALGRVVDQTSLALLDEFGQGAEVADDDRGPLGERFENDIAEGLVDQRRDDDRA